jgi:transposase-like protein
MASALMADRQNDVGEIANRFGVHRSTLYRAVEAWNQTKESVKPFCRLNRKTLKRNSI